MALTEQSTHSERDERKSHCRPEGASRYDPATHESQEDGDANCQRMPDSEREEREPYRSGSTLLHAERHGEQPSHCWVNPMKCA